MIRYFFSFSLICLFASQIIAQVNVDKLSLASNTDIWFDQQIGYENNEIYTGLEGKYRLISRNTHPFYGNGNWSNGQVNYRQEKFKNITLLYNIQEELVLLFNAEKNQIIKLNNNYISEFTINDRVFKRLNDTDDSKINGFYEIIFEGRELSFFAKRIKRTIIKDKKEEYSQKNKFYIYLDNIYHEVSSAASLLKLFEEDKKSLKTYLKDHKIKVLKNTKYSDLVELGTFCNQLKQ